MPRPRKSAHLYQRPDTGEWVIRDGTVFRRTGCRAGERREAENALAEYIATRQAPRRGCPAKPSDVTVGAVLARYVDDKGDDVKGAAVLATNVAALARFWGDLTCDTVTGSTCRAYQRERAKPRKTASGQTRTAGSATVRRELGVLQAALNHAKREGLLLYPPEVTLPAGGEPRDRWLTRDEVAALLRAASPHARRFILL